MDKPAIVEYHPIDRPEVTWLVRKDLYNRAKAFLVGCLIADSTGSALQVAAHLSNDLYFRILQRVASDCKNQTEFLNCLMDSGWTRNELACMYHLAIN